tara:strand:- start:1721 stop:2020 length:300 start_codon:yes stop_codon:yes gene_type:complete
MEYHPYQKNINNELTKNNYPYLNNKLYTDLAIPYGLSCNKIFKSCDIKKEEGSCIDPKIYDELISLVERNIINDNNQIIKNNSRLTRNKRKRKKFTKKK